MLTKRLACAAGPVRRIHISTAAAVAVVALAAATIEILVSGICAESCDPCQAQARTGLITC